MASAWEGIFTILFTPFEEDGALDEGSLQREVDFVIEAGCHGIVAPVNSSEFALLSERERRRVAEIVVKQTEGRVPVVIGTAASEAGTAEELTRHARGVDADGVIAMPPYVVRLGAKAVVEYYQRIARAAEGLPVVIQNVGGEVGVPMGVDAVMRIVREVPSVEYVKEETVPSTHQISKLLAVAEGRLKGVFGGSFGRYLVDELKHGARGLMSGCHLVDAQVRVYELMRVGKEKDARAAFVRQLPVQELWTLLGPGVAKEVLRRRGVFRTAVCRRPVEQLDAEDVAELEYGMGLVEGDMLQGRWLFSGGG